MDLNIDEISPSKLDKPQQITLEKPEIQDIVSKVKTHFVKTQGVLKTNNQRNVKNRLSIVHEYIKLEAGSITQLLKYFLSNLEEDPEIKSLKQFILEYCGYEKDTIKYEAKKSLSDLMKQNFRSISIQVKSMMVDRDYEKLRKLMSFSGRIPGTNLKFPNLYSLSTVKGMSAFYTLPEIESNFEQVIENSRHPEYIKPHVFLSYENTSL